MVNPRVIRSESQHSQYLERIAELVQSAVLSPEDKDEMETLLVLVESYEAERYPIEPPDPVEAIKFCMDERGLRQVDLVPYLGSRSRVSEVLKRKRPLTVGMIRSLSVGLGIPTDVLVGTENFMQEDAVDASAYSKYPSKEMIARGWLERAKKGSKRTIEDQLQSFLELAGVPTGAPAFRRRISGEAFTQKTLYSLHAWVARVVLKSREISVSTSNPDEWKSEGFVRDLTRLSVESEGPAAAIRFLRDSGIRVVIEPHLRGTQLDGASLVDLDGSPVIGLTVRHDRLDSFWFTLLHEIGHLMLHAEENTVFLDDTEASSSDRREVEANRFARDALIPRVQWVRAGLSASSSEQEVRSFARSLGIHPAIVAGRIRWESKRYTILTELVGGGDVRSCLLSEHSRS